MPNIHVDEQVMTALKDMAVGRTPNDVIRQLLGFPVKQPPVTEPGIYLIPHSPKEFRSAEKLSKWLSDDLAKSGLYLVASVHYWRRMIRGSVCLFHKDKMIIGEGKLAHELMPYSGGETSPATGARYSGQLQFDPASVKIYNKPVPFIEAEKLLGGTPLTWRAVQKLTAEEYSRIEEAAVFSGKEKVEA